MKNYNDILGVESGASEEEIKKAYRKQVMKWHPDRHEGKDTQVEAEAKFKDIVEAHENIKKGIETSEEKGSTKYSDSYVNDMMRDFMGRAGFNFGNRARQEFFEQVNIQVSFKELYNEEKLSGSFQVFKENEIEKCLSCDGQGQRTIVTQQGNMQAIHATVCHTCQGQGFKSTGNGTERKFKVGANIRNLSQALSLGKIGSYNHLSEEINTVMIKLDLIKSSNYHLVENGMGLMMTLPVSFEHLRDGKKLRITVFNNKVTVDIPPKPSMQSVIVVPNKGMPMGNNHRGNLYLKLDLKY